MKYSVTDRRMVVRGRVRGGERAVAAVGAQLSVRCSVRHHEEKLRLEKTNSFYFKLRIHMHTYTYPQTHRTEKLYFT